MNTDAMNTYAGKNILEYIEWLMDECGMSEEDAERIRWDNPKFVDMGEYRYNFKI